MFCIVLTVSSCVVCYVGCGLWCVWCVLCVGMRGLRIAVCVCVGLCTVYCLRYVGWCMVCVMFRVFVLLGVFCGIVVCFVFGVRVF